MEITRTHKIVFSVLLILLIFAAIKSCNEPKPTSTPVEDKYRKEAETVRYLKYQAFNRAQHVIKSALKAPSTADFPDFYDEKENSKVTHNGDTYVVQSYVDSQNSFGAMLRAHYTVTMIYMNGEWTLTEVIFDGEKLL